MMWRTIRALATALLALTLYGAVFAAEPLQFSSPEEQERFERLTAELRCLVCQNQSLADSDAPLAHDLRNEVYLMMQAGNTDKEIYQFMVDRYGDFVLYRPPVQSNTLLLWIAPGLLLIGGAVFLGATVKRRNMQLDDESDERGGNPA